MRIALHITFALTLCGLAIAPSAKAQDAATAALPAGVRPVWDLASADRQTTATRERVCINGLWRWHPASSPSSTQDNAKNIAPDAPPSRGWGYFKVPGCWPGNTDYMQKDCQILFAHPSWKSVKLSDVSSAWYEREITTPAAWQGKRVGLCVECLNSQAVVYVDGKRIGELGFPGGELDLTPALRPGATQVLSMRVAALPLKAVLLSYTDTNAAREVKGHVARRGLCGDVFLKATPAGPRLGEVRVETSVRKKQITIDAALLALEPGARYTLHAHVMTQGQDAVVKAFRSEPFDAGDVRNGRVSFTADWLAEKLWDTHTPQNLYDLSVALEDASGRVLDDSFRDRFGFREFWIDGRDFYLNGTRIHLSAVPLDNAQVGAWWASYDGAKESMLRLQSFGINFVYTHNYSCEPGAHLSFAEVLRAADDTGMLVALSQPHFSQYDWDAPDADAANGYARHAEAYTRVAGSHPSVVAYAMSHNACGYGEDMNPDMIDGLHDPRSGSYEERNFNRARRAEAIVKRFDPQRIVYHHAGGNIGALHSMNFYPNFVPIQEMSDWFEHWATVGVKPAFTCEYGAPFAWDWGMYRGWYKGEREWGSAVVPWQFCLAEWDAQFLGDDAYKITAAEKENLRWEANLLRGGRDWHRWDEPHSLNAKEFDQRYQVMADYLTDNWRAFRTWGVSGISPWEHDMYWKLRPGVDRARKQLPGDWEHLQRPGFSADYIDQRYERMDMAYGRDDWEPTPAARALIRNNRPLLAYIAGKPGAFTSKDHLFTPGETVDKQLIVINNARESITCNYKWKLWLLDTVGGSIGGAGQVNVKAGEQARVPLRIVLPNELAPGNYTLKAEFRFSDGQQQEDTFTIDVVPAPLAVKVDTKVALWDPKGETALMLKAMGVTFQQVDADADVSSYDVLVVGKAALTVDSPAPDIANVRQGLRVLMFEQTGDVLEKRFGFRVEEYGLRNAFPRVPDHPVLAGLTAEHLRDWRGAATLLLPKLSYTMRPRYGPTVDWCGIPVTHLWRCGNRGNVASVLIEKPARGDFTPIIDGGYSLQYSALLEYRQGRGAIVFCQADVTGRTEEDPIAQTLARRLLQYVSTWQPQPVRTVVYAGDDKGKTQLETAGVKTQAYDGGKLSADDVLVIGPGGENTIAAHAKAIGEWIKNGGHVLAVGLDAQAVKSLPLTQTSAQPEARKAEHIAAYFAVQDGASPFAGVGPADVHNRDPRDLPLITGGADTLGDGVLASTAGGRVVFCQMAPWQFGPSDQANLRVTYRRASFLLSRLLANMGVQGDTPIVERFHAPVSAEKNEKRWLAGLYMDQPTEWDDPYRHFRW